MKIRSAATEDIPAIVDLLKISLGESLLPKSEAYWRWKHIDNPFGTSPVLLAEDEGVLIGVRAFMRWTWTDGEQVFSAVRAVDTATHPDHQGKGIFKKLTLQLVEESKANGIHFVFNTPNEQSRPGYLKMNWQDAGRLPVRFLPVNPLLRLAAGMNLRRAEPPMAFRQWLNSDDASKFWMRFTKDKKTHSSLSTPTTQTYFTWRYATVPVVEYFALSHREGSDCELLIYRFKPGRLGKELRVTDFLTTGKIMSDTLFAKLKKTAESTGTAYITFSGVGLHVQHGIVLHKGPMVTVRHLSLSDMKDLINFQKWSPSLGDLELF
jgi:N-acetylglutamate synthase-like GNAT family acetyltransferase